MISIPQFLLEKEEPFFVCSRSALKEHVNKIRLLGVDIFYSVKTNFERDILTEIYKDGCGFSVSNQEEFLLALSTGVKPENVYYYERGLTDKTIEWLVGMGCTNYMVDTQAAFEKVLPKLPKGSTLLIRLKAQNTGDAYSNTFDPGLKTHVAKDLIARIKKSGLRSGVLHHSSSQVEDISFWKQKFAVLSEFSDVDIINIGGGIPVAYNGESYSAILDEIKKGIKSLPASQIIAEPGRALVGPACSLITKVRLIDNETAVVNCSVYNTHIDTIIADIVLPCRTIGKGEKQNYQILGSSLCNLDIFNPGIELPKLSEGDSIIFDNAGAYNVSSAFGSGPKINTYLIE